MKTTATQLVAYWTCPFLWHVSYEAREPLPVWGTRRRFGNVLHAAIAEYERQGRSLESALRLLEEQQAGLTPEDLAEARSILTGRHGRALGREGRPVLVEGSLRAHLDGHRLEVRLDRLDQAGPDYVLSELKGGKSVDLELVRTQLGILSYAVWDVFGRAPARWEVELLRAGRVVALEAETDPAKLAAFARGLLRGILGKERAPAPYDPAFCTRCPARSFCPRASSSPKPLTRTAPPSASPQLTLF